MNRDRRETVRANLLGVAFTAPGVMVMALLIISPILRVVYYSLIDFKTVGHPFAGLQNYARAFQSHRFLPTLWNTFLWTLVTTIGAFAVGFFTALLLQQDFIRRKGVWRGVLMLPWITPGVVTATLWKWLYSYDFGMLNHMLVSIGIVKEPVAWITSMDLSFPAVMLVQIWATFPYAMLILSAGFQTIPQQLYEAAEVAGASPFQRVRVVTIPMLRDVISICILILTIWSLNGFATIWIITQGGPAGGSQILSLTIYERFRSFNIGSASAIAVLQLMLSLVFAGLAINRSLGKEAAR